MEYTHPLWWLSQEGRLAQKLFPFLSETLQSEGQCDQCSTAQRLAAFVQTYSQLLFVDTGIFKRQENTFIFNRQLHCLRRKDNTRSSTTTEPYPVSVFGSSDARCATGETIVASVLVWAHNLAQHLSVMRSLLCGRRKKESGSLSVFSCSIKSICPPVALSPRTYLSSPGVPEASGKGKVSSFKSFLIHSHFLKVHLSFKITP